MSATIVLVTNSVGLRTILVSKRIERGQLEQLYQVGGADFRAVPKLAKRWGLWAVLTPADYESYVGDRDEPPAGLGLELGKS